MKIEILLTDLNKKAEVMTHLARDPGLRSTGNELEVEGLKLEIGETYLLFTITLWERAEELVPLLFSLNPAHSAHIFRPESGMKVLVTCPARPVRDIIPELTLVEHLDLAAEELAGDFQMAWGAHDVAVAVRGKVMVQGGLAVAKINFITQGRDTEYHCRDCLGKISFKEVLAVFCRESLEAPAEAVAGPVIIQGKGRAGKSAVAEFVNARSGLPLVYDRASGELRLVLGPGSRIAFREAGGKDGEVLVHLEGAGLLTDDLASGLKSLGLPELKIYREIRGAVLDLSRLRDELGFRLEQGLTWFVRSGEFLTSYDAVEMKVRLEGVVPLEGLPARERAAALYLGIEEMTGRVMACAG